MTAGSDGFAGGTPASLAAGLGERRQRAAPPGTWTDRLLLVCVGAYSLLVAGLMAVHGVAVTPDVVLVAMGLGALIVVRTRDGLAARLPELVRELLPLGVLFLAYELMRGYTAAGVATVHSEDVLAAERWLFLGWLPTQVLQAAFHVPGTPDLLAMAATVFYFLHFALPLAVGLLLWTRRRDAFDRYIRGLIVLSIAAFATYLVLPVAPPWYAAEHGTLLTGTGEPAVQYLKIQGFGDLAALLGLDGTGAFRFAIHDVNPNLVGAFPSLHAGYPMLAFLLLRQSFGRRAWLMLVYAVAVWLSVVYLADHYVVDILGGVAYACGATWLVTRLQARPAPAT